MILDREYWRKNWPEVLVEFPDIPDLTQKLQQGIRRSLVKTFKKSPDIVKIERLVKAVEVLLENLTDLDMTRDDSGREYKDIRKLRFTLQKVKNSGYDRG